MNDPPSGTVAMPLLFIVRPSTRLKMPAPGGRTSRSRFVMPVPDMIPFVQLRLLVTVTVPGPVTVPFWNASVPIWKADPALAVSVPPFTVTLDSVGLSETARVLNVPIVIAPAPVAEPPAKV